MRVLICSNAYPPHFVGGAELMAHEQAKALTRMGHDVAVFAGILDTARPRYGQSRDVHEGIAVTRIGLFPEDYSPEYLNFIHPEVESHFREVLAEFQPDIVHCHNLGGLSVKLPILASRHGAATVCTLHDFWGFCLTNTTIRTDGTPCDDFTQCRSCVRRIHDGRKLHVPMRFRKDFMRLAFDHVIRFVAPSRFVAQRYLEAGLESARISVLANGIDLSRFHPSAEKADNDELRVTYVGYFGAHKGVLTLLDALALVHQDGRKIVLQLAGEGPERKAYEARARALGIQDRVKFFGKVNASAVPGIYQHSDVVVLPSIWDENQPVCLMEAMAAGVPVVASRKGGIPEMIDHGENGLMFTAGDASDLAAQLARLIDDPALRKGLADVARSRVAACSHDRQAQRLVEIYAEAIAAFPPAGGRRDLYLALGSLRRKMSDESTALSDHRYPTRAFVPRAWIADILPAWKGVVLTGVTWSAFRRLGLVAMLPISRMFRKTRAEDRKPPSRPRARTTIPS